MRISFLRAVQFCPALHCPADMLLSCQLLKWKSELVQDGPCDEVTSRKSLSHILSSQVGALTRKTKVTSPELRGESSVEVPPLYKAYSSFAESSCVLYLPALDESLQPTNERFKSGKKHLVAFASSFTVKTFRYLLPAQPKTKTFLPLYQGMLCQFIAGDSQIVPVIE